MSCNCQHCDDHQNSSFIFGLVFGLIIGALIAVLIYKNNKDKVFKDLKKKLSEFFNSLRPKADTIVESFPFTNSDISKKNKKHSKKVVAPAPKKSGPLKKEVVLPPKLIAQSSTAKISTPKSKPRVFKK